MGSPPCHNLPRDWAHPHATSAPGLGSPPCHKSAQPHPNANRIGAAWHAACVPARHAMCPYLRRNRFSRCMPPRAIVVAARPSVRSLQTTYYHASVRLERADQMLEAVPLAPVPTHARSHLRRCASQAPTDCQGHIPRVTAAGGTFAFCMPALDVAHTGVDSGCSSHTLTTR